MTTAYFSEIEDGIWELDTPMRTGDYEATVTANDEEGAPICQFSVEFALAKDTPTKIDTVVACGGGA